MATTPSTTRLLGARGASGRMPLPRAGPRSWCGVPLTTEGCSGAPGPRKKQKTPLPPYGVRWGGVRTPRGVRRIATSSGPWRLASIPSRPASPVGAPRLRLLTFAVSVRGALGSEAQTFIRQLSARMAGAVPYRLLDEASWATQGCAPLLEPVRKLRPTYTSWKRRRPRWGPSHLTHFDSRTWCSV